MNFTRSKSFQEKSHSLIPGGCHTYAKGDDQYPELSPGFIVKGKGCHVWDVDGNRYIEYGMGLRSVTLGHAYPEVVDAASRQMQRGNNFTRPSILELECAQEIVGLIEAAEMVKFAKNGSDATTAAVKLARAFTGKDLVAICADQPFFSTDDWFIGSTAMASGVPQVIRDLTVKFHYNDLTSVERMFDQNSGKIACVIMEAATAVEPENNFLHQVRELCHQNGALFILDEMITGFRWHIGGAQQFYEVEPDLSVFGKGMGNGFSIAALVGKREIMELGGVNHSRERVFLLSATHGAECHALAACLATVLIYKREHVVDRLNEKGQMLSKGIRSIVRDLALEDFFQLMGMPSNLIYVSKDPEGSPSQAFRTLFLQETIKRGLLMPSMVVSYSHSEEDIKKTVDAVGESLWIYKKALEQGVEKYLVGRPSKPVFRTFN